LTDRFIGPTLGAAVNLDPSALSAYAWDFLPSLALGVALAACAGLRAWLPLLLAGCAARVGLLQLGASFDFIASNQALALFTVATLVEIAADKLPALDHALDTVSTVIRPAAGALLAASVMWKISDPLTALALGVAVGAPSALVPHAAKSALRAGSTALTGGLANPFLSFVEDVLAFVFFLLAVVVPIAVALLVLAFAVFVVRRLRSRGARSRDDGALPA
jgi:hypothetical protein